MLPLCLALSPPRLPSFPTSSSLLLPLRGVQAAPVPPTRDASKLLQQPDAQQHFQVEGPSPSSTSATSIYCILPFLRSVERKAKRHSVDLARPTIRAAAGTPFPTPTAGLFYPMAEAPPWTECAPTLGRPSSPSCRPFLHLPGCVSLPRQQGAAPLHQQAAPMARDLPLLCGDAWPVLDEMFQQDTALSMLMLQR
ncbi:hypothetical protein U9M48_002679 [Paspalum notatum var. saurae]|uniref:Uncharacterized protein n=1 Tax=Paspalum notatum var. saurae TaxID=547442 RepID=A0AAQ3SHM3_PASNO